MLRAVNVVLLRALSLLVLAGFTALACQPARALLVQGANAGGSIAMPRLERAQALFSDLGASAVEVERAPLLSKLPPTAVFEWGHATPRGFGELALEQNSASSFLADQRAAIRRVRPPAHGAPRSDS